MTAGGQDGQARWQRICAVLDAVFDAPDGERERVLAERCDGDPALRAEVEAMLAAEDTSDRRLDTPAADWAGDVIDEVEAEAEAARSHSPGETIGDYRLVRELGRGGMGAVWLAERTGAEFSQQVALKLLKRGLDTEAVLGRFYDERRILARLRHPHIALFLDGGVADSGQPWFTMEWVDGAPITEWCDARGLGFRERVALFLDAVAAVQYAHQQLIVHRDLKPGNVLVSESGEVKLLDFGIAKMLDTTEGSAQAATMTRMGVRMLTPAYAAPEQLRGDPATTATDVYALGVLLGELLCGKRPVPKARDVTDAPVQRPSSQVEDAAASLRGTTSERLRRLLRGDLDTIVLKALSEEPARRYGSAQAFGEDLQRWLDGQPVQARPDSAWYRARRFIGRHRLGTAAAAVMALSLATGALVATWQAREANRQAELARRQTLEAEKQTRRAEQVKDFLVEIFRASSPREWKGKEATAKDLMRIGAGRVDQELRDPILRAQMQRVIGEIALSQEGDSDRAEALLKTSMETLRRLEGENSKDHADALHSWAWLLYEKRDYAAATSAVEREIRIRRQGPQDRQETAQALGLLASLRYADGDVDAAVALRREAVDLMRHAPEKLNSRYAEHLRLLGQLLVDTRRFDEALPLLDEAMAISRKLYGPDSMQYANALNGRGKLLSEKGDLAKAEAAYHEAAGIFARAGSAEDVVIASLNRGDALCRMGRFADAGRSFREGKQALTRLGSSRWADVLDINFGKCLSDAGAYPQAEALLKGFAGPGDDKRDLKGGNALVAGSHLVRLRTRQGRSREAVAVAAWMQTHHGPIRGTDGWQSALFLGAAAPAWFAAGDRARGSTALRAAVQDLRQGKAPERAVRAAELDLAEMALQDGSTQQAEAALRGIERRMDGGADGPQGLRAQMLRGVALMQMRRLAQAEPLLRHVVEARRRMYGDDNPWTGEARLYLGICLQRAGKLAEALPLIERGRGQFTRASGQDQYVVRLADAARR